MPRTRWTGALLTCRQVYERWAWNGAARPGRHTTCGSQLRDQFSQGLDGKEACTEERSSVGQALREPAGARRRAQGLVEYGLIIAVVAVLTVAGLIVFGKATGVTTLLSKLSGSV